MAVPKKRKTSSKRDRGRANIHAKIPSLIKCPKCGKPVISHTACSYCGYYKEREVINVLAKLEKKEKKKREKEIKTQESGEKKPLGMEELSKKK